MARPRAFDTEVVLDKAMKVFWDKGFAATSAQDLVDSTGLGRGSLYNAFVSKEQFFYAALRRYDVVQTTRQEDALVADGSIYPKIRALLMTVVEEEAADSAPYGCMAVNTAIELAHRDPTIRGMVRDVFERMENALHAAFQAAQVAGEIPADIPARELARYVLNSMYGLRVLGKTASREALSGVVDLVLRSVRLLVADRPTGESAARR